MTELNSVFLASTITIFAFLFGCIVKKRFKSPLLNPMIFGIFISIGAIVLLKMDYREYAQGTRCISFLLTPATVCLAIPLYEQFELLKKNISAVLTGIISGVIANGLFILLCAVLFKLGHNDYVSLLPKSITTAIGIVMSEQLSGCVPLTVAGICITGITGNMFGEEFCRFCKINNPIAKGVAMGTASHVIGTSKAMEMGEVEGAFSSLSLIVTGIISVGAITLFAKIL